MLQRLNRFCASVVLAVIALSPAHAQKGKLLTLTISVTEDATGRPLPEVQVGLSGVTTAPITDAQGRAVIRGVSPGQHLLSIAKPGYAPERLALVFDRENVEAEIAMLAQAVELDGVTVTSWGRSRILRDNGYYNRQHRGLGVFLDRNDITRMHAMVTADLFRQIRGYRVGLDGQGQPIVVGTRMACIPDFYLDGMAISKRRGEANFRGRSVSSFINPLDLIGVEQIEAIEAYPGPASIPPQYNDTGSACGVILIWTRAGS